MWVGTWRTGEDLYRAPKPLGVMAIQAAIPKQHAIQRDFAGKIDDGDLSASDVAGVLVPLAAGQ